MSGTFDAGPVYLKSDLSLEGSTAEEVYIRASELSCKLAAEIAKNEPSPQAQEGELVIFKRRTPKASEIPHDATDENAIFDHIRMLDATDYPRAFLEIGNLRIEFSRAALYNEKVCSDATITIIRPSV
ncbi:hypothetical protein [Roseimaritima sediminicola]|uniref:hypothetical protein n=1 Tax=Roseimaritima sediminicola TaxID=2662066 RepID=UPI00192A4F98|nr:hypothetical protein [Roseimaritima sediminicola]